jgi:hypothetical protein
MWFLSKGPAAKPDPAEALRSAIRARVDRAVGGDLEASGGIADEVQRLAQLLAAYEQSRAAPPRRVWPVLALVLAIAMAVAALLFLRVPSTEVTLALDLSSLIFRVGSDARAGGTEQVELLGRIHTDEVTIDDVDAVEVDDAPVAHLESPNFKLSSAGGEEFSIRPLDVPVGTWVRVRAADEGGGLTVELAHPSADLAVALSLPADAELRSSDPALAHALEPGLAERRAVFRAQRSTQGDRCARLRLRWLASRTSLATTSLEAANALPFRGTVPVDALLFIDLTGGSQHLSTLFSSVMGGSIYLEEVGGREVPIRRDQLLDVGLGTLAGYDPVQASGGPGFCSAGAAAQAPAAPARIQRIALGDDGITLHAAATVDRLSTGTATHRQNLMPRWLEWLQTRPELLLFWGAFGSLFGLAYAVLLWWRGSR